MTMFELDIPSETPKLEAGGPIAESDVIDDAGNAVGGIMLWISDKRLSTLEFYWFSDERPNELPQTNRIVPSTAR